MEIKSKKYWLTFLALSVFSGFLIRFIFLLHIPMIETDGVFYATLGRKLVSLHPWEGIDAYWPPFYPVLIGLSSFIFKDLEFSGRIVSAIIGSILIIPAFFLIREIFQEKVAKLSVILMIFHPRLVISSQQVLTEITYAFLVVTGIFTGLIAFKKKKIWLFLLAGLIFGLSYLTRPEGFLIYILMVFWVLFFPQLFLKNNQTKNKRSLIFLAFSLGFFIFALPYLFFVKKELGYWAISEKSSYNFYTSFRSEYQKYGLAPAHLQTSHQESKEIAIKSDKFNYKPLSFALHHPWTIGKRAMKNILRILFDRIPSSLTYNFALVLLFGIFLKRRGIPRKKEEIFLCSFVILAILQYSLFTVHNRFFIFLLPLLIAWTVVGFLELERIIGRKWGNYVFLFLVLPSIFYFSYKSMTKKYDLEHKEAGIWLKNNAEKFSVIMSRKPYAAFYSGNLIASIPEGSYKEVTIYAKERKADYLVIDERYIPARRPELKFLLNTYSLPKELEMVYRGKYEGKRIIIYRWLL
ncbi:MAG TPA: glycosyltransferase family 39 protein [bacterium]|nr:glycosyltransferase family 39 protein [bacterium]